MYLSPLEPSQAPQPLCPPSASCCLWPSYCVLCVGGRGQGAWGSSPLCPAAGEALGKGWAVGGPEACRGGGWGWQTPWTPALAQDLCGLRGLQPTALRVLFHGSDGAFVRLLFLPVEEAAHCPALGQTLGLHGRGPGAAPGSVCTQYPASMQRGSAAHTAPSSG